MAKNDPRRLALTAAHVARITCKVEDSGVPPGVVPQTDADYQDWVERIQQSHPQPEKPTQLFAYGSLIWKPEIEHVSERPGTAQGWHRSFCFRMPRFRGTPEKPGLMMALDRGGSCKGVLFELPPGDMAQQLDKLFRREFTMKPINSMPKWITVKTEGGIVPALGFVMNRDSPLYVGGLAPDAVADVLATTCGHWGTGAEYLLNTVASLEAKGIRDSGLWLLQQLVAEKIDGAGNASEPRSGDCADEVV
jgi:glutathione-specific gamma-glutamylcyclotransferase